MRKKGRVKMSRVTNDLTAARRRPRLRAARACAGDRCG